MELALERIDRTQVPGALRQRNTLLSYVMKLKKSIDQAHHDLVSALTVRLTETAIDYLSYGHFKLFLGAEPTGDQAAALQVTTEAILDFEARYSSTQLSARPVDLAVVADDLEALALTLNARFEIEDEILSR